MACRGASSRAPFNENSGYSDTPDEIINQATVAPIKYLLKIRPVLDKGDPDFTVNTADVIVHAHVTTLEQSNKIYLTHRNLQVDLEQVTVVKNGQVLSISNISDKQGKIMQIKKNKNKIIIIFFAIKIICNNFFLQISHSRLSLHATLHSRQIQL